MDTLFNYYYCATICPDICVKELQETTKCDQDRWCSSQDANQALFYFLEYKSLTPKLLLALASTVIHGSESHGTHDCLTALGAFRPLFRS
jgi:hypothetical protein